MNHAITIGGLLLSIASIVGFLCLAFGMLMVFAAGMSDAGDDGTGKSGCITAAVGLVLLIGSLVAMFV